MGIDTAPFWDIYSYKSNYVQGLISLGSPKAFKFGGTGKFIDNLMAVE